MSLADRIIASERLTILRMLSEAPRKAANDSLLHPEMQAFHPVSRQAIREHLLWLTERGLVATQEAGSVLTAVLLTAGEDVAAGRNEVPGVARPSADSIARAMLGAAVASAKASLDS